MTARDDDARELLALYRQHRLTPQVAYYAGRASLYERALRRAVTIAALLFVAATLCGALATVDVDRRGMWAFLAAALAALATAMSTYEAAFGFERYSRQYAETLAAVRVADAARPVEPDGASVEQYVAAVERLLRSENESWSEVDPSMTGLAVPPAGAGHDDEPPAERR